MHTNLPPSGLIVVKVSEKKSLLQNAFYFFNIFEKATLISWGQKSFGGFITASKRKL